MYIALFSERDGECNNELSTSRACVFSHYLLGDDLVYICSLVDHGNVYMSRLQTEPMQDPEQGVADVLACVTRGVTSFGLR
jgi:hypothetical protein